MKQVFADTLYWVASITPGDPWHAPTLRAVAALGPVHLVTTEEVMESGSWSLSTTRGSRQDTSRQTCAAAVVCKLLRQPLREERRATEGTDEPAGVGAIPWG